MIIYNRRGRGSFTQAEKERIKQELVKMKYPQLAGDDLSGYTISHIIPFLISQSNSFENLELLRNDDYEYKKSVNRRVLTELRKQGFIESITDFVDEIKDPENTKLAYSKIYKEKLKVKMKDDEKIQEKLRHIHSNSQNGSG